MADAEQVPELGSAAKRHLEEMSRVVLLAQPSTIFVGAEIAARRSCETSPKRSSFGNVVVVR
jgi:hypothetical protein